MTNNCKINERQTTRIFFSILACDNIIIDKWDMKRRCVSSFVSLLQKNMDKIWSVSSSSKEGGYSVFFHSLYNICEEYYWLKKSKCVKKGEICWFFAERSCKVIYWIFVQKGSDREHLNFMNNKIDTLIRNAIDAHDYETALKRLSLCCFNWLKESIAV